MIGNIFLFASKCYGYAICEELAHQK